MSKALKLAVVVIAVWFVSVCGPRQVEASIVENQQESSYEPPPAEIFKNQEAVEINHSGLDARRRENVFPCLHPSACRATTNGEISMFVGYPYLGSVNVYRCRHAPVVGDTPTPTDLFHNGRRFPRVGYSEPEFTNLGFALHEFAIDELKAGNIFKLDRKKWFELCSQRFSHNLFRLYSGGGSGPSFSKGESNINYADSGYRYTRNGGNEHPERPS